MFNIGSNTSRSGASSRRAILNWPLAILFAGLALNLAWIVGLAWLTIKLAFRLLVG
jgi:hypothetical protein